MQIDHNEYPKKLKKKMFAELLFNRKDAAEALAANPDGQKASYYADEICYVSMEIKRRQAA